MKEISQFKRQAYNERAKDTGKMFKNTLTGVQKIGVM